MTVCLRPIERARPLLGTTVAIRVSGLSEPLAHKAIDEAFEDIGLIHRLMSFHERGSDLSRLNRALPGEAVPVDPLTFKVLRLAKEFHDISRGCFDVTVAPRLVALGNLPAPDGLPFPDEAATSDDIVLLPGSIVRLKQSLWIDLGGIAKGFAVDLAVEKLIARGAEQVTVNAGGDLRIHGPDPETVRLRTEEPGDLVPILKIESAAVASSSGHAERRFRHGLWRGPHFDGRNGQSVPASKFASVIAPRCVVADALTKIVLAMEEESEPLLVRYGATAHLYERSRGWRHLGTL